MVLYVWASRLRFPHDNLTMDIPLESKSSGYNSLGIMSDPAMSLTKLPNWDTYSSSRATLWEYFIHMYVIRKIFSKLLLFK